MSGTYAPLEWPAAEWLRKKLQAQQVTLLREGKAIAVRSGQLQRQNHPSHRAHQVLLDLNGEMLGAVNRRLAWLENDQRGVPSSSGIAIVGAEQLAALMHEAERLGDEIAILLVKVLVQGRPQDEQEEYRRARRRLAGGRLFHRHHAGATAEDLSNA